MAIRNDSAPQSLLLDQYGRPMSLSAGDRDRGLMGAYDSYDAVAFRYAPFNPDALIASKGYQALDELLHIGAIEAALSLMRNSVMAKGWTVQPMVDGKASQKGTPEAAQAQVIADALTAALRDITDDAGNTQDFRQVLWEILYAAHIGFQVTEINWRLMKSGPLKGKYGFSSLSAKTAKQIGFDVDLDTLAPVNIVSYTPMTGYRFGIPIEKVIRYTFRPQANLPYGKGLGRPAYKHGWSMDFLNKFWNVALEVFGTPFILAKATPGKSMELARQTIARIRQGAPAVLPDGVEAELIEIAGTGIAAYSAAMQYHASQVALIYLGNTLTSGTSTGGTNTNALGQVHQDTQDHNMAAVRSDLENVVTLQLFRRFVRYNYGEDAIRFCPALSLGVWDAVDMQQTATAFGSLIKSNVVHEQEPIVRSTLGLPPPEPEHQALLAARSARRDNPPPPPQADPTAQPTDDDTSEPNGQ